MPLLTAGIGANASGERRSNTAAITSAQDSGLRKQGTLAAVNWAIACGASGTSIAASGLAPPALSMIGLTASSGCDRADDPTTASTRSNSGAASMMSSAPFITS